MPLDNQLYGGGGSDVIVDIETQMLPWRHVVSLNKTMSLLSSTFIRFCRDLSCATATLFLDTSVLKKCCSSTQKISTKSNKRG